MMALLAAVRVAEGGAAFPDLHPVSSPAWMATIGLLALIFGATVRLRVVAGGFARAVASEVAASGGGAVGFRGAVGVTGDWSAEGSADAEAAAAGAGPGCVFRDPLELLPL